MKTTLLTIAMFLACIINGMLLIDAFAIGKPPANVVTIDTPSVLPQPQLQSQPVPQKSNVEVQKTEEIIILSRWDYKRWQPIRNIIRYFHNRRLCCW